MTATEQELGRLFVACIATRLLLWTAVVVLVRVAPAWVAQVVGAALLGLAAGALWAHGSNRSVGAFGQPVWWGAARLVHVAVWATSGALLVAGVPEGAYVTAADPALGGLAYMLLHPEP